MRFGALRDWLAWQEELHPKAIDLGLDRVKSVHRRLALPSAPFTITVAGTNGKGSCVAYLASILCAQGYRVGSYTSPHLLRYNERICIDREPVADDLICRAFERIDAARGEVTLSFFEFGTLAALDIFSGAALDVQILEVGLGGRLDAVNIVDADAVLLASIAIDHEDWLGNSREAIGREKAGVLRSGCVAVIADPDPPASVLESARSLSIDLAVVGRDFHYATRQGGWDWSGRRTHLDHLPVPILSGQHQFANASAVLQILESIGKDLPVGEGAVRRGLSDVRLTGRFQVIPGETPIVLDVAHNVEAVGVLARQLREHFPGRKVHAVFALMRDKDLDGVINEISDLVEVWYLPELAVARAAAPAALREALRRSGVDRVECDFSTVSDAANAACRAAKDGDLVVVFGSFFLVAEYLAQHHGLCG